MKTNRSLLLTFILFFIIAFNVFSNTVSLVNVDKVATTGYVFLNVNSDEFTIIQKITQGKNSKMIAFWSGPEVSTKIIKDALINEQSSYFNKNQEFNHNDAFVTRYTSKADKSIYLYDIVFKSTKNPKLHISVNFTGKVTLTKNEIAALMREAESFVK